MTTLIIPCAGRGKINGIPKYLNRHPDGQLLVKKSIEGIEKSGIDKIIITILKQDVERYNAFEKIQKEMKSYNNIKIHILEKFTSGPAETVYKTILECNINGSIIIKDSDNYVKCKPISYKNYIAGLNIFEYDIYNIKSKSFIIINEQCHVMDIVEKQLRSDLISVGMYGIKDANQYVNAYEKLSDPNYGIESLYVSHIISYIIGHDETVFHFVNVDEYENYGTEEEWNRILKKYMEYRKNLAIFDLDGTLFDTKDTNYCAYKEALRKFGFDIEYNYYCTHCNGKYYVDFLPDIVGNNKTILEKIHNEKKSLYNKYLYKAKLNEHLLNIIRLIRDKYFIAIVTTASRKNCNEILRKFNIDKLFDLVITKEDITKVKPDPEGFNKAMDYFGILAKNTIIFEDSDIGLAAAKATKAKYYKVFGYNEV